VRIIDEFGCELSSSCFNVIASSLQDISNDEITIFPNPASEELNILNRSGFKQVSFDVLDKNGRILISENLEGAHYNLKLDKIPNAYYIIRFQYGESILVKDFIKLK